MGRTPSESDGQAAHVAGWNAAGATLAAGIGERMGDHQGLRAHPEAPAGTRGEDGARTERTGKLNMRTLSKGSVLFDCR